MIENIKNSFKEILLKNIDNSFQNGAELSAFIMLILAIDCLGGFYKGEDSSPENFSLFMNSFENLRKYDSKKLYNFVRSGLAHNFTIKQNSYLLVWNKEHWHLKQTDDSCIIINFQNFYRDFLESLNQYFALIESSPKLKFNIEKRYSVNKIIAKRKLKKDGPFNSGFDSGFDNAELFFGYGAFTTTVSNIKFDAKS